MFKLFLTNKAVILSSLFLFCNLTHADAKNFRSPACTSGFITELIYNEESEKPITIVRLSGQNQSYQYYTDKPSLRAPLAQAFSLRKKIKIYTGSCTSGDFGFAEFSLIKEP